MICYCTNIWNHHQGPVCAELAKLLGSDNFRLMLHQPLDHKWSKERIAMGWNLIPPEEPWILGPPKTCETVDYAEQIQLAKSADVLIYASNVPYVTQDMLLGRHKEGRLSFRIGERFFKEPLPWFNILSPKKWAGRLIMHHRYEAAGIHFLTMGYGCAEDLDYYWACRGRTWRWGYFTGTSPYCCQKKNKGKVSIGWCGRMLDWKHVDYIIRAIAMLPAKLVELIEVDLVGNGSQEQCLKDLARQYCIDGVVRFHDSVSADAALEFMKGLDVYIFPSNRKEGWGAALLEAMDKGCAVVANESAGSTLEVVEDGVNGFTFKDGNIAELATKLERLIKDGELRQCLGQNAWRTIQEWSPRVAASKLLELVKDITNGTANQSPSKGICGFVR